MLAISQPSPRICFINLFMPPSTDPLLTPYRKELNPKIIPIKRSLSILSNLKQYPTIKQPKAQLTDKDYAKINRSYQSLKKFRKSYMGSYSESLSEVQIERDPQYLRLIQIRKAMLRKRLKQQRKIVHSFTATSLKENDTIFVETAKETRQSKRYYQMRPKTSVITNRVKYTPKAQASGEKIQKLSKKQ